IRRPLGARVARSRDEGASDFCGTLRASRISIGDTGRRDPLPPVWKQPRRPDSGGGETMSVKGGRLEFLVPHLLRSQVLRPRFVRLSLKLGAARQMPRWAKLQFLNCG